MPNYEVLSIIHSEIREAAKRLGIDRADIPAQIAQCVEERLRREVGGALRYIPTANTAEFRAARNLAICRDAEAGLDDDTLSRQYDLHPAYIRRIRRRSVKTSI